MTNGPREPAADLRVFAARLRDLYLALLAEGFATGEALFVVSGVAKDRLDL